jgi:hypothetical protein
LVSTAAVALAACPEPAMSRSAAMSQSRHWIRRHRALALGSAAVLVLAVVGNVLHLRAVTTARDRADSSEKHARRALDELTLKHAQLQLVTDPSAALDALSGYHGSDVDRADQIRAEANGRGVARLRARPHMGNVFWVHGLPGDAVLSLSSAGGIMRTAADGTSVVVASGTGAGDLAYAPRHHLLAYSCTPASVCMYDVLHEARIPLATVLQNVRPTSIALSPNGDQLAVMSQESELMLLDIADPARPALMFRKTIFHGGDVKFFYDDIIAVCTAEGIEFVHLRGGSESFAVPENSYWDGSPDDHLFFLSDIHGQVSVMEGSPVHLLARAELCRGRFALVCSSFPEEAASHTPVETEQ